MRLQGRRSVPSCIATIDKIWMLLMPPSRCVGIKEICAMWGWQRLSPSGVRYYLKCFSLDMNKPKLIALMRSFCHRQMRRQQKALYIRKIVSQLPRSVAAMEIMEIYRTIAHMIKNVDPEAKVGGAGLPTVTSQTVNISTARQLRYRPRQSVRIDILSWYYFTIRQESHKII